MKGSMTEFEAEAEQESNGNGSLGEAAQTALSGIDPKQEQFDDMDYAKVKFVGMAFDSLEQEIKIGDEHSFLVRARCIGTGDEELKDGHIRHVVKMDVSSVILHDA